MSPWTSNSAVKVISARLGRKLGLGFVAYAVTEDRIALEIESPSIVLVENILGGPFPVDELPHLCAPRE
jgi:hypothetical protein